MNDFEKAFKEFVSLADRYRFIAYETDSITGDKRKVEELLFWADWEKDQISYNDEIEYDLESEGKSEKQIEAMKDRAITALNKFIGKWETKGYKSN